MSRLLLLSTNKLSSGGANLSGVLRMAIGLKSLYQGHKVLVVLLGDAVLCGLKRSNPGWVDRYIRSAEIHEVPVYVEAESLEARHLTTAELATDVEPVDAARYLELWRQADLQLRI
ncbi:MAG: DsrE family protein [Armatimonadetes bacterium]|nr:DsrE family protein [Armatimonadota bacterium]